MSQNLEIIKGDDVFLSCTFTDENGDSVDISNADLTFTAKEDYSSTPVISKTVVSGSHTTPESGITQIHLTNTETNIETGNYFWDIQLTYGSGIINSVSIGKLRVLQDLT